jgi:hypothetical protein
MMAIIGGMTGILSGLFGWDGGTGMGIGMAMSNIYSVLICRNLWGRDRTARRIYSVGRTAATMLCIT